jgi:tetratricopeptide (TPR) repeat protein
MTKRPFLRSLPLAASLALAAGYAPAALAEGQATVAITPLTGAAVADAVTMLLIDAVGQLQGVRLLPPQQSLSGQTTGATWVISGTVKPAGKGWAMALDATGPEKLHWDWNGGDLADAVSRTCLRLASTLHITPAPAEWQAVSRSVAQHNGRAGWDAALAGRRWLLSGQPERAAERFRMATAVDPSRAVNWLDLARACRLAGDRLRWQPAFFPDAQAAGKLNTQSLEAAKKAAELAPSDGRTWGALALAQALAAVPMDQAEATLAKGVGVDPQVPELKLAAALIKDDIPSWQAALSVDAPSQDLLAYAGARAFAGGDLETARTYYQQARQLDPTAPAAAFGLARTLTQQGRPAEALPLAQELTKTFPAAGQWLQGTIHQAGGDLKAAQTAYDAAAAAQPNVPALLYYQGRIRHALGDPVEALRLLRQAYDADPNLGPAAYTIGVIYQDSLGSMSSARPFLEAAQRLQPDVQADVQRRLR